MTFQPPSNPQFQPASNHLPTPFQPPSNPCSFQPLIPHGLEPPLGAGFPQTNDDGRGGCKCLRPPAREPACGVSFLYSGRKKVCTLAIPAKLFANLVRFAIFGAWLHRLDGKRFDRHRVMRDSGFKGRALPDPFPV